MKRVRVGIIGLGVGARHAAGYAAHPDAEVIVLCDQDEKTLTKVGALYPTARRVTDADDLLADDSLDIISIASYDADHYSQAIKALTAGKHVFVEKPLCLVEEETRHIRQLLTEQSSLKLSSHFPLRQVPRFLELRKQVHAGKLGEVYLAEASYLYGRWEKITHGWRGATKDFSPVLGGGVHLIDLLRWLTGKTVVEVFAFGTRVAGKEARIPFDDCVISSLRFSDGLVAQLTCDLAGIHPHYHGVSLFGTKATFRNGLKDGEWFVSRAEGPRPVRTAYRQERQIESTPFFTSFVDAVLGRGQAVIAPDDVFAVMSVAFAMVRSLSSGRPEKVEYI